MKIRIYYDSEYNLTRKANTPNMKKRYQDYPEDEYDAYEEGYEDQYDEGYEEYPEDEYEEYDEYPEGEYEAYETDMKNIRMRNMKIPITLRKMLNI